MRLRAQQSSACQFPSQNIPNMIRILEIYQYIKYNMYATYTYIHTVRARIRVSICTRDSAWDAGPPRPLPRAAVQSNTTSHPSSRKNPTAEPGSHMFPS